MPISTGKNSRCYRQDWLSLISLSLTEDDAMQGYWRSRKEIYLWLVIIISIVGLLGLAVVVGTFLYVLATFT